jgi:hypothetical protein
LPLWQKIGESPPLGRFASASDQAEVLDDHPRQVLKNAEAADHRLIRNAARRTPP